MMKTCPHCHCEFECRNDNVLECDCVHVILSREALDYISKHYRDCLCVDCLGEINRMLVLPPHSEAAQPSEPTRQSEQTKQFAESERYDLDKTLITNHHKIPFL